MDVNPVSRWHFKHVSKIVGLGGLEPEKTTEKSGISRHISRYDYPYICGNIKLILNY